MREIDAGPAARAAATGAGVRVGVIDGGVDFTHPDLAGAIDVGLSCSFINSDDPTADPAEIANGNCANKAAVQDLQGHGTHVATTIAGRINGIGIAGVAPDATIVALKACTIAGFCFVDSVAAALRYAGDHHLDVVNLSLFADPFWMYCRNDAEQRALLKTLSSATKYAQQHGVVVVASAGNEFTALSHPTTDEISPDWPPDAAITRDVGNRCMVAPVTTPGSSEVPPLVDRAWARPMGNPRHMGFEGFTADERSWLASQRLGRLATVAPDGTVGNAPVTYFVRVDDTIDIGGMRMGETKKFRNVEAGSRVAFVVDIVDTSQGWHPIYLEIRGTAEALRDVEPPADGFSREVIRIHPGWVRSFNLPPA